MNKYSALIVVLSAGALCAQELPTQHTVQPKDTLWDLAQQYYHDPYKWPNIAQANPPPTVKDPHWIYPKQVLQIPVLAPAASEAAPVAATVLPTAVEAQPTQEPAPAPVAETTAASAPVAEPAAPAAVIPQPQAVEPTDAIETPTSLAGHGFSNDIPDGLVGLPPSFVRFKESADWKPDGVVLEGKEDGEQTLFQGDLVDIRIDAVGEIHQGDRYVVLRKSTPTDADEDQHATYLSTIGIIKITGHVSGKVYRGEIMRASDTVQADDMIKKRRS